jgi:Sec-independent protein translocase protein TatA
MQELLKYIDFTQILGIGVLLVVLFGDKIPWLFSKAKQAFTGLKIGGVSEEDEDILDMVAAKRLSLRAKRRNCPEMSAAMLIVFDNFFHQHDETPSA